MVASFKYNRTIFTGKVYNRISNSLLILGYKGYQVGYHNEAIRGAIQNRFVYNKLTDDSGWFYKLEMNSKYVIYNLGYDNT
ncbi:hypothetical protein JIP4600_350003 [Tenacibaculum maritimum]|nr:hypothetical protein JIP4600_350003 [Tenacibaculum maritimum]